MIIEPRIYSLLETLGRSDLAWLAEEVIQGLVAGHVPLEAHDAVIDARTIASRHFQDESRGDFSASRVAETEPMTGEEQVEWATLHVTTRLRDIMTMLRRSFVQVDQVVAPGNEDETSQTQLVFVTGELEEELDAKSLAKAEEGLILLEKAIFTWLREDDEEHLA